MSRAAPGHASSLDYPFAAPPAPGQWLNACEGIAWYRMPLPFALDHVNCWLLGEPGDQVLIDTGVASGKTRDLWLQGLGKQAVQGSSLASENQHDSVLPVAPEKLLVTHFHPDHMGLSGWFAAAGSQLLGSAVEVGIAQSLWQIEDTHYSDFYAKWYGRNGLPEKTIDAVRSRGNTYRKMVCEPAQDSAWTYLADAQSVILGGEHYQVMTGRGHAPDMIMLYRARDHVLIAADQVLPSITPNVSVMPRLEDPNPLHSFLATLERLEQLPEDTLVLPSHGLPFRGMHARIRFLAEHHEQRLDEVLSACQGPVSAHDLFNVLFRRELDPQQTSFALGESLAHLHYLEHLGKLSRRTDNAVEQFQRV